MQYTIAINLSRATADRCDVGGIARSVSTALGRVPIALRGEVACQNNALESLALFPDRSVVKVGVATASATASTAETRAVTVACVNAILHSAGLLSQAAAVISSFPAAGDFEARISLLGPIATAKRTVESGYVVPVVSVQNALSPTRVAATTDPSTPIGTVQPSGLGSGTDNALDKLGSLKTPIIIVSVAVGLTAIAITATKVKALLT